MTADMPPGTRHIWRMRDGLALRLLRIPIWRTRNDRWARDSRLVFRPAKSGRWPGYWVLSPLGVLHGLFGLTVEVIDTPGSNRPQGTQRPPGDNDDPRGQRPPGGR